MAAEVVWGLITSTDPLLVRIAGDYVDTPVQIRDGTFEPTVGLKVVLIKVGQRWWLAGTIGEATLLSVGGGGGTVLTGLTTDSVGNVYVGSARGLDGDDGKHYRPFWGTAFFHSWKAPPGVPRTYGRHWFGAELSNPSNIGMRRSQGWNSNSGSVDNEMGWGVLAATVADITTATELTLDTVYTDHGVATENAFPTIAGGTPIFIRNGSQCAYGTYTGVDYVNKKLTGFVHIEHTGSTAYALGAKVSRLVNAGTTLGILYAQADMGQDTGYQDRGAQIAWQASEPHRLDMSLNGFFSGTRLLIDVNTPGPHSQRARQVHIEPTGMWYWTGSRGEDVNTGELHRFVFNNTGTRVTTTTTLPATTIPVDAPAGFPTSGTVDIENSLGVVQTITYTSYSATGSQWTLNGCTGGTGTLSAGAVVRQNKTNMVAGFRGGIMVLDYTGDAARIKLGSVGPNGESGIEVAGDTALFRDNDNVWGSNDTLRVRTGGGSQDGVEVRDTSDSYPRVSLRSAGVAFGAGSILPDVTIKRSDTLEVSVRNVTDTAFGSLKALNVTVTGGLAHQGTTFGAFNASPVTKPTVTGSRGGNAALASLLSALAGLGLITDSTSA